MNNIFSKKQDVNICECLICLDNINSIVKIKCIRCNIYLHNDCFQIYNRDKKYTLCPHCQRVGVMGIIKY